MHVTLGTRAVKHEGWDWDMQLIDCIEASSFPWRQSDVTQKKMISVHDSFVMGPLESIVLHYISLQNLKILRVVSQITLVLIVGRTFN